MFRDRQGFMQGINMYVPAMQWAASVNMNGGSVVSLGRPLLANDAYVIANTPTNGLANSSVYFPAPISLADATYGRPLVLTTLGAGTATLNVFGEDYLGQPMSENFAPTSVTPVVGKKAFYRVLGVKTITGQQVVRSVVRSVQSLQISDCPLRVGLNGLKKRVR